MVYLFLGQEQFLKNEMLQKLRARVCGRAASGLNYDEFQAGEVQLSRIIDSAKTAPFMAKFRLVVVRDVNRLNPQEKEALPLFIKNKPPFAVLALAADSLSASDPIYKAAERYGKLINFDTLKPAQIYKWASDRFAHFKKKISHQAASFLIDNIGNNLTNLNNAIELLVTFVGERIRVETSDVEALTGKDLEATAYQLVDAIAAKDASLALELLHGLDKDAKTAPQTIGFIAWHMRRLWRARKLLSQGMPATRIAMIVGAPQYASKSFLKAVNNFSSEELERDFKLLLRTDKEIKTKVKQAYRALELLAIRLCSGAN